MTRALAGERCIGIDLFELPSRGLIQYFQSSSSPVQSQIYLGSSSGLRNISGLRDRDFLLYLEIMEQSLNTSKTPFPRRLDEAKQLGQRIDKELRDHKFLLLSRMLLTSSGEAMIKEAEMVARPARCSNRPGDRAAPASEQGPVAGAPGGAIESEPGERAG